MNNYKRQILLELLKVRKELSILNQDCEETKLIENNIVAVQRGYTEFYEIGDDELSSEKSEDWFAFIYDVLTMYSRMINSVVNNQGGKHSYSPLDVRFPGFDGNNEFEEMKFVEFFIVRLGNFGDIEAINKGDYNSHAEMTNIYKRMLSQFRRMGSPTILDDKQISDLLNS